MTYSEKLRDPRWQRVRLKVMEAADFRCQICGAKDKTLNVHHSYYRKGKEPWQYPACSMICVCEKCHELIHGKSKAPKGPLIHPSPPVSSAMVKDRFAQLRAALNLPHKEES